MTLFVVVAESDADARIAQDLADRVVYDQTDTWCDESHIETVRSWADLEGTTREQGDADAEERIFTKWSDVKKLFAKRGGRFLGHTSYGSGSIDSAQSRKAIQLFETRRRAIVRDAAHARALILVRDMDNQPERRKGMNQAREMHDAKPFDIIIGAANPKREAWVLNGFEPKNDDEERALKQERRKLGSNPRRTAHTLAASQTGAKRNEKRVVDALVSSPEREAECWKSTDLDILRERGTKTGLTDFLDELRSLVKHFDPAET